MRGRPIVAMAVGLLTACASTGTPGAAPTGAWRSPSPTPPPSAEASTVLCAAHSAAVATAAGPISAAPIDVLLDGLANPDDLLVVDDRLQVGELAAGRIRVLAAGLAPTVLPVATPTVEGMTMLNGILYVADQAADRVRAVTPTGLRTVLQLRPVAGTDGLDSIGSTSSALLVPDSARGTVNVVTPDGATLRSIGGFMRPTAALQLRDGSVLIADENAGRVVSVAPDGSRSVVAAGLTSVDDVAIDSTGAQFAVTESASGRLVQLGADGARDIATSLVKPQGLAVDGADNLLITESQAGRVEMVVRTFRALPFAGAAVGHQPLCLALQRAPGFTGNVQLDAGAGIDILAQPGRGVQARISVGDCGSPCRLTARSGALESTVWVRAAG